MRHTWDLVFPWGLLDGLAHLLRLPRWICDPICDRFDRKLNPGIYDGSTFSPVNTTSGSNSKVTFTWTHPK